MRRRSRSIETLEPRVVLASDPIIAEFQAINGSTIQDKDGDFEDWIEIRNPGIDSVNLDGWYLTDDKSNLTEWKFPAVTLQGGEQILVFASNKGTNVGVAGEELHTNFRLAGDGEFLALVRPDGKTIVQSFDPYPAQLEDQSYGLAIGRDTQVLIADDAPVKAFVPTDGSLANTWQQSTFTDTSWASGTMGVGYEELAPGFTDRDEFDSLGPAWTVDLPVGSASSVVALAGNLTMAVAAGDTFTFANRGKAPLVHRAMPGDSPADFEISTQAFTAANNDGSTGIAVLSGTTLKPLVQVEYYDARQFRVFVNGTMVKTRTFSGQSNFFMQLSRDGFAKTWTASFKLNEGDAWQVIHTATDGDEGLPSIVEPRIGMYTSGDPGSINSGFQYLEVKVADQRPVYAAETGLNVSSAMKGQNSSIFLRAPFTVTGDPTVLDELDLKVRYDDGFVAYINGVEVAARNVDDQIVNLPWDSAATGEHGAKSGNIPVDRIDAKAFLSALKPGENLLAVHALNIDKDDSDFFFDITMTASEILSETRQVFITPTPGQPNEVPAAPSPIIVGNQGIFFGTTSVTLELPVANPTLEIRYTLDGTEPTATSTLYTGPFTLTESARLEARTFDASGNNSFVPSNSASGTYFALDEDLRNRDSDIPLVILDTLGGRLPATSSTDLVGMNVIILDTAKATGRAQINGGQIDYLGRGGARDRGSSTAGQPKPNMAFEIWGASGLDDNDDDPHKLLGMDADSDWVLHAPYNFDRTLIHNQLAFDLSNEMDMWAPDYRHVEVYMNTRDGVVSESDYAGVYVLMEKISQGEHRVDVADIDPDENTEPEISGGFIWKKDRADAGESSITLGGVGGVNWVYPKSLNDRTANPNQKVSAQQQQWAMDYFNAFNSTIRSPAQPDINDPEGYSKYIDPVSWVDHHLLNVLMMNVDALRLSGYFHKDREGKITYGPVWDFDRALESADDRDDSPQYWRAITGDLGTDFFGTGNDTPRWWSDLFRDPGFWQLYVDRWQEWRSDKLSDEALSNMIDRIASDVEESQARNFTKWRSVGPRRSSGYRNNVLDGTWEGEIENMRVWLHERAAFMDANFVPRASVKHNGVDLGDAHGKRITAGQEIQVTGPDLPFNDDTRLISGEQGATVAKYLPIGDDNLGTTWTTRTFNDSAWKSGPIGLGFDTGTDFTDYIKTEVDPRVDFPNSTTFLVRIPFQVNDLASAQSKDLVLRMIYDDGFVAYLNGQQVAIADQVEGRTIAWDQGSASRGRDTDALNPLEFDISQHKNLLVQGTNVLSIRMINQSRTSNDMLLVPELVSREQKFGLDPNTKVYYTTDGSDPRGPNGMPSPSAQLVGASGRVRIDKNTRLIARSFNDVTDRGSESAIVKTDWSGPREYNFVVADTTLAISEVHYNPAGPTAAELVALPGVSSNDFEFVELYNWGTRAVDLNGVELTDGVEFDFFADANNSTLGSKQYGVLVANPAAFQLRYGNQVRVLGQFRGSLDNASEDLDLIDGTGAVVFSVNYRDNDLWGVAADGLGASLELKNPNLTPQAAQSKWYSWRSSGTPHGTPGAANSAPTGIVINEVIAHTEGNVQLTDSIELHNTTTQPINIGGWWLSDSGDEPFKYQIPAGTTIAAGGYTVFNESQFNAGNSPTRFGLSASGDNVWLVQGTVAGGVTRFVDDVHFDATLNGESLGRMPNGSGRLAPLNRPSFGNVNTTPRVGPVVISEISYNPVLSAAALAADPTLEASDLEFIEIHNPTAAAVSLTNWRIRGGADYDFPAGTSLAAGQSLVVLKFNPDNPENVNQVAAFRAHYGIGEDVRLIGGYAGLLNNSDDRIELLRPDPSSPPDDLARVQEDEVLYDDLAPWPAGADGVGRNTLQRKTLNSFGNDGESWTAGPGSPGSLLIPRVPGDSNGDGIFNSRDFIFVFLAGKYEDGIPNNATFEEGDWDGDGDFTSADFVYVFLNGDYSTEATPSQTTLQPLAVESLFREIPDVDDDRWLLDPLDDEGM